MYLSQLNPEQSHVWIKDHWYELMQDQEGCFYYLDGDKAHYVTFEPEKNNQITDKILLSFCFLIGALYLVTIILSFCSIL